MAAPVSKLQAMDLTSLKAVLAELEPVVLPSRFEKAQQLDAQTMQLALRTLAGSIWLELSWLAEAPRLHAIDPPPRQGEGSTLAQQLQHGLRGLALVAITQPSWERVVELGFARRPGEPCERTLVLELMGRHSNLFLLDAQRQVISLARQVREQQSRLRPISTGDPYQAPPPLQGEPPSLQESMERWLERLQLQPLPLGEALLRSYQGVSPALLDQLLGHELAAQPVKALSSEQWQLVRKRWLQWLNALEGHHFGFSAHGAGYCCWSCSDAPPPSPRECALSLNAAVARYYGDGLAARQRQALQQQWRHRLSQQQLREQRLLAQQQLLLSESERADALKQQADALLCQANPSRASVDEAQALYKRARRLRRSAAVITGRIDVHQQRLAWLETSLTYLEQVETLEQLKDLVLELGALEARVERHRRPGKGARRSAADPPPQPLELRSPGGLRLQVGRNHRQNEWISLRQARRGDLWFHAQECPGSHVVLKASEQAFGDADVAAAAHLAAYFSRGRGNARVPVVMVQTSELQRIPGAQPGTVRHGGGEVLWGMPSEAAVLLAAAPSLPVEPSA
ncbi:MAG: Rqc2 family fibronectin-binding protein [Prochlorococcaceae cyanobacterium]